MLTIISKTHLAQPALSTYQTAQKFFGISHILRNYKIWHSFGNFYPNISVLCIFGVLRFNSPFKTQLPNKSYLRYAKHNKTK